MSQMFKFDEDLEKHMDEFKKFKENYLGCIQKLSNLQDKFDNAQKEIQLAKKREYEKSELLLKTQNICKQQLVTIKNLKLLTEAHNEMKKRMDITNNKNEELHEKLKELRIENNLQLEIQSIDFEKELEKQKQIFSSQIQELQEELSLVLASSEIQKNELEVGLKNLKLKYEDDLKNLKATNNRLQSTVIIYEKQKHEAEQKYRLLEEEKKHYASYQNISSEKNTSDKNNSYMCKYFKNTLKNVNKTTSFKSINNNLTQNQNMNVFNEPKIINNIQESTNKYFQQSSEISSQNPSSQRSESNASTQNDELRKTDNFLKPNIPKYRRFSYTESDCSSDSENEKTTLSRSFQNYRSQKNNTRQRVVCKAPNLPTNMMPLPIVSDKKDENVPQFPASKKRKLYNPNNFDDLDDFFVP